MTTDYFIAAIEPVPGHLALLVTWRDQNVSRVDLAEHIHTYEVLTPLRELRFFARVQVGQWGLDVEWPNDIQIAASTLQRLALERELS